jgi:hypothetical protein
LNFVICRKIAIIGGFYNSLFNSVGFKDQRYLMNVLIICVILQSFIPSAGPIAEDGYKEIDVVNGGSISGTVIVKGKVPRDEMKTVKIKKAQCGETIPAEKYVISSAGEVKWAVVIVEGIGEGKKLDKTTEIVVDNKECRFVPHVQVAPTGGKLRVRNSDPMLHNSHFYLVDGAKKKNVINLALPKKGQELTKARILRRAGLLSVECDAHDWMQGYIWSLPHPYGTVTDERGSFALTDIPAGSHTLKVWHEALGEKDISVEVKHGRDTQVKIEF